MGFIIPDYASLDPEQKEILNLNVSKNWVIQGGPGTGKTVLAIYRAAQLAKYGKTVLLVYNRPLKLFLAEAVDSKGCEVKTYNEWVTDAYKNYLGRKKVPRISGKRGQLDYAQVEKDLYNVGEKYLHAIFDEAQDCPFELLRTVERMSKNITCFVDPNQEILPGKLESLDMIKTLCVEAQYPLTRNFRNTKQVRDASAIFCRGAQPAIAFFNGPKPELIEFPSRDYEDLTDFICDFCEDHIGDTIGIITDYNSVSNLYDDLEPRLSDTMPVQMFKTMKKTDFDFEQSGVQIFSFGTMKGLEFDHVIIARIEAVHTSNDEDIDFNRLYVAMSRPRQQLIVTYFYDDPNPGKWIDPFDTINDNPDVFEWEEYK